MKRLLFLDVDGVLNDLTVLSTRDELGTHHLQNLKMIVCATKCDIVLSSSWRILENWKRTLRLAFEEHQIPLWISETPRITSENMEIIPRSREIISWLVDNSINNAKVVVLDDEADACIKNHDLPTIQDKFIHTCMNFGLTSEKAQEAINFLK